MTTLEEPKKATEDDIRCSNACTKAGITALLFSALAISLLVPIDKKKSIDALKTYISLRSTLSNSISELGEDPCWKNFKSNEELGLSSDRIRLTTLVQYQCENDTPHEKSNDERQVNIDIINKESREVDTAKIIIKPPKGMSPDGGFLPPTVVVIRDLYGIADVVGTLVGLSDRHLIDEARQVSEKHNHYLYTWGSLLERLSKQNKKADESTLKLKATVYVAEKKMQLEESPAQYLTLADAKRLSSYDPLTFSEIERPVQEQMQFSLSPSSPLLPLKSASIFVQIVVLISLVYFYIFQCEAKRSSSFPAPATLFGAFSRKLLFRFIFYSLLLFPPVAAILLAMWSSYMTYLNFFFAPMIIAVSFGIWKEYHVRSIGSFRFSRPFASVLQCLTSLKNTVKRKTCQLIANAAALFQRSLRWILTQIRRII